MSPQFEDDKELYQNITSKSTILCICCLYCRPTVFARYHIYSLSLKIISRQWILTRQKRVLNHWTCHNQCFSIYLQTNWFFFPLVELNLISGHFPVKKRFSFLMQGRWYNNISTLLLLESEIFNCSRYRMIFLMVLCVFFLFKYIRPLLFALPFMF